jgi:hypothetical protein
MCLVFCALYFPVPQLQKYQAQSTKFNRQSERQATLAIACLYLNLTHLLRGGQVRAGVYARFGFLAMIPATQWQVLYKKDLAFALVLSG